MYYELNLTRNIKYVELKHQTGQIKKGIYDLVKLNNLISNQTNNLCVDIICSNDNKSKLNEYLDEYNKYINNPSFDGLWISDDTTIKIFVVCYFDNAFVVVTKDNNFEYHVCVKIQKVSDENNKYILTKNSEVKFELNKTVDSIIQLEFEDKQYYKIEADLLQNTVVQDFINRNDIFKNLKDIITLSDRVSYKYVVKYKLLDYLTEYNSIRNQLNNPNMLNKKAILEVLISNIILLINAIKNRKYNEAQKLEDEVISIETIKNIDLYVGEFINNNQTIDMSNKDNKIIVEKLKNKLISDLTKIPNKNIIMRQRYASLRQKINELIVLTILVDDTDLVALDTKIKSLLI